MELSNPDGTLLLIDDDDAVRRVVARALRTAGYRVHDHPSGEAGIEFVRCHAGPIDLLITDTVLPRMNGIEAAEAIRLLRPGLPVLQMSGYPEHSLPYGIASADFHFIGKPFRSEELARRVRDIIGAPAGSDLGVRAS